MDSNNWLGHLLCMARRPCRLQVMKLQVPFFHSCGLRCNELGLAIVNSNVYLCMNESFYYMPHGLHGFFFQLFNLLVSIPVGFPRECITG